VAPKLCPVCEEVQTARNISLCAVPASLPSQFFE
jgi:hypothetical protein